MQLRQQKFYTIKNAYDFFKNYDNIFLFVHVNDYNTIEDVLIRSFLKQNNIKIFSAKLNIIKKITTNVLFQQINSGPTKLVSFLDFSSFLMFYNNNNQVIRKLIPLGIFWKGNFFSYIFFKNNLQGYIGKNFVLNKNDQILLFLKSLIKNNNKLILSFNFSKLILLLNIFISKSKC